LAVQLTNNARGPVLLDLLELLAKVHFAGVAIAHARPPNGSTFSGQQQR